MKYHSYSHIHIQPNNECVQIILYCIVDIHVECHIHVEHHDNEISMQCPQDVCTA